MTYGNPFAPYQGGPLGDVLEATPEIPYSIWSRGARPGSRQYDFLSNLFSYYQKDYGATAALPTNYGLKWTDYLASKDPMEFWKGLAPRQRGEGMPSRPQYLFPK